MGRIEQRLQRYQTHPHQTTVHQCSMWLPANSASPDPNFIEYSEAPKTLANYLAAFLILP